MNYEQIAKANSEISTINLKGKEYAPVSERVTAFRKLYPEGFIKTDIVSEDGTVVLMHAAVGYYENGNVVILGTGYAQEVKGKGNSPSFIVESCETSAVGRALGMAGIGIGGGIGNSGGICSAEEFINEDTKRTKEENAAISNERMEILLAVDGNVDALNEDIKRITGGEFSSLDGMGLSDLILIRKIVSKKYGRTEA